MAKGENINALTFSVQKGAKKKSKRGRQDIDDRHPEKEIIEGVVKYDIFGRIKR